MHRLQRRSTIMGVNDPVSGGLDRQWYVLKGQEVLGPLAGRVVLDMYRDRRIGPEAMVALPGSPNWQPISVLTSGTEAPTPAAVGYAATSFAGSSQRHYAGFWIRVGAYLIDSILLSLVVFVVTFLFFFALAVLMSMAGHGEALQRWIARNNLLLNLLGAVFWIAYGVAFTAGRWQATPGKRICGIYVMHDSGERIGYGRAFGRLLGYYLDTLTLGIGFMMAGWARQKRALHDLICSTRVVYGRPGQTQSRLAAPFE